MQSLPPHWSCQCSVLEYHGSEGRPQHIVFLSTLFGNSARAVSSAINVLNFNLRARLREHEHEHCTGGGAVLLWRRAGRRAAATIGLKTSIFF